MGVPALHDSSSWPAATSPPLQAQAPACTPTITTICELISGRSTGICNAWMPLLPAPVVTQLACECLLAAHCGRCMQAAQLALCEAAWPLLCNSALPLQAARPCRPAPHCAGMCCCVGASASGYTPHRWVQLG